MQFWRYWRFCRGVFFAAHCRQAP